MSNRASILTLATCACLGLFASAAAQNQVLSLGKPYAYFITVPGQPPNHYMDDGPIAGVHDVHTKGLGAYDVGNLTDGATSPSASSGPGTPHLALWAQCCGNAPPADIIIDLGIVGVVSDLVIGTVIAAALNNNAPDDVTVSFSVGGTQYTNARFFDLEGMYGPLADGHHDMPLKLGTVVPARFVKLSFDGGSMKEPNGSDPDEKWMLDEITVRGLGPNCTAASSSYGTGLAGNNGVPTLTVSAPPKFATKIDLLASNSSGAATLGLLMAGLKQTLIPFLGGTLLVEPLVQFGVPIPAGGLVVPVTLPGPPCQPPVCLQLLQFDAAATAGVSMTRGLRVDLGN